MDNRFLCMTALLLGALSLVSCSDEKSKKTGDAGLTDAGKMVDAGKPDAGKTDAGTTMTMTAMPVPCGMNMCRPPTSPLAALGGAAIPGLPAGGTGGLAIPMPVACCLDAAAGTCGVTMMTGGTCEPPATRDMRCPAVNLGALAGLAGNMGFGCCINAQCGVDGSAFGRGCVANAEAGAMLSAIPLVGGLIMVPPARACDADTGNDAGSEPSGNDAGH